MTIVDHGGWWVAITGFVHMTITFGVISSFVVLFLSLEEEFESSAVATGWMGSLAWGITAMFSPISTLLVRCLGHRLVAILGVFFCFGGLLVTAFMPTLWAMYISFGLVFAAGTNMITYITFHLLSLYYPGETGTRQYALANLSGGVSLLVGTVLIDMLITAVGWRTAYSVMSGVMLAVCLPICIFYKRPLTERSKPEVSEEKGTLGERSELDQDRYINNKSIVKNRTAATKIEIGVTRAVSSYDLVPTKDAVGVCSESELQCLKNHEHTRVPQKRTNHEHTRVPQKRTNHEHTRVPQKRTYHEHTRVPQKRTLISRLNPNGGIDDETLPEYPLSREEIDVNGKQEHCITPNGKIEVCYIPCPSPNETECEDLSSDSILISYSRSDNTSNKKSALREFVVVSKVPGVWLFAFGVLTITLASIFNVINLVSFMDSISLDDRTTSLLMIGLGLAETFGRIVALVFGNSLPISGIVLFVLLNVAAGVASLFIGFFPNVPTITLYIIVAGITRGIFFTINIPVCLGVFPSLDSGVVITILMFSSGLGGLLSSTFGGLSMDITGSYEIAFFTCSAFYFVTSFFYGSIRLWPKLSVQPQCTCWRSPKREAFASSDYVEQS